MQLKIKLLHPDAIPPRYALPGDAGLDLYSLAEHTIVPGEFAKVETGIALEIPEGYAGLIWDKGSLSFKHQLKTMGGVFDSGYRGDITIGIINLGTQSYTIEKGDKIAQILIQKVENVETEIVETLATSQRDLGRFGSTGKK